jgi:hypothetical protein
MPQMCAPIPSELKKYDVSHLRLMMNAVLSLHNGKRRACESIRHYDSSLLLHSGIPE